MKKAVSFLPTFFPFKTMQPSGANVIELFCP
jgi:hypothetical protein